MQDSALIAPLFDPTPIFDIGRSHLGSQILTAAVAHFDLFGRLGKQPLAFDALRGELGFGRAAGHMCWSPRCERWNYSQSTLPVESCLRLWRPNIWCRAESSSSANIFR